MALDRSKFKSTSVASMVQADKEVEKATGKSSKERADQLTIEEGKNKFRFYPAHPEEDGGGDKFAEPVVRVFLPMMVEEMKDGKPVMEGGKPKMKESAKPVFNSRIHGGTEKDLVEEYRNLAQRHAKERFGDDSEKIAEYYLPIAGRFSKSPSERLPGIQDRLTWVAYADKILATKDGGESFKFGRLEFGKSVKDRLNKLAAMENGDEPLGTDPFTPIEGARAVIVVYNKEATKPADYYITEMDTSTEMKKISGKEYKLAKEYSLTDEQLEKFLGYPTLKSLFVGSFKRSDFELQLRGLEFFDKKYKMGLWELPEWEEIVAEISEYYAEESSDEDEDGPMKSGKASTSDDDEEEEEEGGDKFDQMDRDELKAYNRTEELGVAVKSKMSDDDLRNALRKAEAAKAVTVDDEDEEEEEGDVEESSDEQQEEQPEEKKEDKKSTGGSSLKDKLAKIKGEGK